MSQYVKHTAKFISDESDNSIANIKFETVSKESSLVMYQHLSFGEKKFQKKEVIAVAYVFMYMCMRKKEVVEVLCIMMMRVDRKTKIIKAFLLVLLFIRARGRILVNFI